MGQQCIQANLVKECTISRIMYYVLLSIPLSGASPGEHVLKVDPFAPINNRMTFVELIQHSSFYLTNSFIDSAKGHDWFLLVTAIEQRNHLSFGCVNITYM